MHAEEAKDHIDEVRERGGTKYIALLIAGLTALLAIVEMTGDNSRLEALKSNTDAASLWSFYQAKAIRQTTLRGGRASSDRHDEHASGTGRGGAEAIAGLARHYRLL
ncbi:DUF4337 domain-containing protein [Microvirga sp. KLBC 81]|nr:DUF4337 family protein [Microvirga sp. KLBC 81]PVE21669.1 DUF4337 domain-containing protein [Microvirga sp. KLBC 81]